ncbi:MAG: YqgE/AlgH family protein [Betaproteobacteria bacterium]|nr:YqgE/AlgH family protein [Betaproteobacteria bacterium]
MADTDARDDGNTEASASEINLTNQFLIAMPGMADPTFNGSVVFLCEHSRRGALGLVINKPTDITLRGLFEKVELSLDRAEFNEQPVLYGGPVQTERGFVLHESTGQAYTSSLAIPGGLEMTTSRDILEAVAGGSGPARMQIMLGYSGWSAGQLEDELSRNGWLTVQADPAVIFDTPVEQRFTRALSLLGVDPSFLSQEAGHA